MSRSVVFLRLLLLMLLLAMAVCESQGVDVPTPADACELRVPQGFLGVVDALRARGGPVDAGVVLAPFDLTRPELAGASSLVQVLVSTDDPAARAATLLVAVTRGGAETRHRAALDLASDARLVEALPERDLATLSAALSTLHASDPALPILVGVVAVSRAADRVEVCLGTLAGGRGERCLPVLRGLLARSEFPLAPGHLEPYLAASVSPLVRRRATHLLARLPGEQARERLIQLDSDPEEDVASEARVGLAGRAPEEVLASCRDQVLAGVDTSRPSGEPAPVERVLGGRDLRALRAQGYTGPRFRSMASGFVLARASADDRAWLASKLPRLRDAAVSVFLRHAVASPWADFEEAW